mgnify:CR=1 FL=1
MTYDLAVMGSGPGGCAAALTAARRGLRVGLIERAEVGGVCLNVGCIPTKALLSVSSLLRRVRQAQPDARQERPFRLECHRRRLAEQVNVAPATGRATCGRLVLREPAVPDTWRDAIQGAARAGRVPASLSLTDEREQRAVDAHKAGCDRTRAVRLFLRPFAVLCGQKFAFAH